MKKYFVMLIALLAVVSIALPTFAVELKYGGMYRARLQSNDNVADGQDDDDDNQNYIDQRLRMYFTFVSSENLQVVTKWEADTRWGDETDGALRHGGGDIGADAVNLEMKNVYIDFAIPTTPVRATIGVQGLELLKGWIISDDFSAAVATAKLDPINVKLGYIAAQNEDVTDTNENVDDVFLSLDYAQGPFKASLIGFYQYGHGTDVSVGELTYIGNGTNTGSNAAAGAHFAEDEVDNNHFFDLGLAFEYKESLWSAYINFVKNLGSVDDDDDGDDEDDMDYEGWMVEAGGNFYCGPFTFSLFGFVTSGDDAIDDDDDDGLDEFDGDDLHHQSGFFRYPGGASHYWSEIMGLGTLDAATSGLNDGGGDRVRDNAGYASADSPSNLWTVSAGVAWQALEGTKLTFNYYYIATVEDAVSEGTINGNEVDVDETGKEIGHELDFYIDQKIVDKLSLRLVGAYLFAGEAYTVHDDDDDAYELGAQLLWAF